LAVSGPVQAVREILSSSASYEPEITAALRLADQAFCEDLVSPSGIAIAWEAERPLRAELAALLMEVSTLLGEPASGAVLDRAVREPYHTLPANLDFFHDVVLRLRTSQAFQSFIAELLQSCPSE